MDEMIKKALWNDGYNTRYGELYPLMLECRDALNEVIETCSCKDDEIRIIIDKLNEVLE